ncbi:MAG: hypothetical protein KKF65_03135, partial [Nanoarchaeota archaeon]|nr:hypothetical protein [Nanoarchaeota archaeon]
CTEFDNSFSDCSFENFHYQTCVWLNDTDVPLDENKGRCVSRSMTCYEYGEADCELDPLNVSRADPNCMSAEVMSVGEVFVISEESCRCYWDNGGTPGVTTDDSCGLTYNITSAYGNNLAGLCNYTLHSDGCGSDGFEQYKYNSSFINQNSIDLIRGDARCVDRSGTRRCGQPVVKIPFFDNINYLIVLFLISIFYLCNFYITKFRRSV